MMLTGSKIGHMRKYYIKCPYQYIGSFLRKSREENCHMKIEDIIEVYKKERHYETCVFGDYEQIKALNFASFLLFLKEYVEKALSSYTGKWDTELPPWLLSCKEYEQDGTAPVKAYEEVIKIMALAGAGRFRSVHEKMERVKIQRRITQWNNKKQIYQT